ncbi:UNVERIFIED_ORG: IS5 family transposase [Zoogloea ramigera]
MRTKPAGSQSADMFRKRLDELVNLLHPLAQLATHIRHNRGVHRSGALV